MLTRDEVGLIKASEGVYRCADVARAFEVAPSTVSMIWTGRRHSDVPAACDFPDIAARARDEDLAEDLDVLIRRGMSVKEAADELGISRTKAYVLRGLFL